jgi:hypothetical protein
MAYPDATADEREVRARTLHAASTAIRIAAT